MLFKQSHSYLHEICHSPDSDEIEIEFSDMWSSQAAVSSFRQMFQPFKKALCAAVC